MIDKDEAMDYLIKNHFEEMKEVVLNEIERSNTDVLNYIFTAHEKGKQTPFTTIMSPYELFSCLFSSMADEVHALAIDKGWWDDDRNNGELIALCHSELSECLEALRHGNPPDDKLPAYLSAEVELADVVIRIMDMTSARGWKVAEAIVDKHEYNKTRDHKHGKVF